MAMELDPALAEDLFGADDDDEEASYPSAPVAAAPTEDAVMKDDDEDEEDDAGGLFGDGESEDDDDKVASNLLSPPSPDPHSQARHPLEYDEEEDSSLGIEVISKQESIAQVELANFGLPPTDKVWHARLPNFLKLNGSPFDELMWEPEEITGGGGEGEEEKHKAEVPDEYVVRWRWAKDKLTGGAKKESNSRIVKWSDGSLSLQIGSEFFDITSTLDHSSTPTTSSLPALPNTKPSPPSQSLSSFPTTTSHSLTYLTSEHQYSALLESTASVHGTLTFRPTTLQSATHKRLVSSIAQRYQRKAGTRMTLMEEEDPEMKKAEREKAEVDRIKKMRAAAKRQAGATMRSGKRKSNKIFSDGEDDEAGEESGEEEEGAYEDRRSQPKRGRGGPLAREDEYEEEDDDGFVVASEEDEDMEEQDDEEDSRKRKKESSSRKQRRGEDEEMDEMDLIDQKAEMEEKRRKERKAGKSEKVVEESAPAPRRRLVVESDEDE